MVHGFRPQPHSAKIHPPRLDGELIVRTASLAVLSAHADRSCIAVEAAAGYGKTTVIRQWLDADPRPAAWVGLDRSDNDPVVLLDAIVAAINTIGTVPGVPAAPVTDIAVLTDWLTSVVAPFVLVLDDVHHVSSRRSVDLLGQLVDRVPPGSLVVVSGRSIPPIHLSRRQLLAEAAHLGPRQLALTDDECRELLARALPDLEKHSIERIVNQTEGWAAGVALAVMALRQHPEPGASVTALLVNDQRMVEYFRDEVLSQVPAYARDFLLRTSVVDELSVPLCNAVCEHRDSATILSELAVAWNPLVASVDETGQRFRYHHLFADLLRGALHARMPEEVAGLHRRAASWLATDGRYNAAVAHAVETGDPAFVADTIHLGLYPAITGGHLASVERWLSEFSAEEIRRHPTLALASGWLANAGGRTDDARRWLDLCDSLSLTDPDLPGTVSLEVGLEALRMFTGAGGVKQTARSASVVLGAGPASSPWWPMARLIEAVASHFAGALSDPMDVFASVEFDLRGSGAVHAVVLAQLGRLRLDEGDPAGHRLIRQALDELTQLGLEDFALTSLVHSISAFSEAVRGKRDASRQAERHATALIESMDDSVPRWLIHHRLVLSDAAAARGDQRTAAEHLAAAGRLLPFEPDAIVLHEWCDRLSGARGVSTRPDGQDVTITAAEMRVLDYLSTHYSLAEIGERLFVSRNTVKSHTISIYRKLDVSSRNEAVSQAWELGLLGG